MLLKIVEAGAPVLRQVARPLTVEEIKSAGLWHILEPLSGSVEGAEQYIREVHKTIDDERIEMIDIFRTEEGTLIGVWQLLMEQIAEARMDAPPIPSPPVRAPNSTTLLPTPRALARCRSSWRSTPTARALTRGFA